MSKKQLNSIQFEENGDEYYPLPIVSTNDNNKVIAVINGAWAVTDQPIESCLQSAKDYADSLLGGETYNDKYSNTESVSGQWVDGRPIYRTVLTFTNPTMSKQWIRRNFTSTEQSAMNIDFYLNIRGMAKCTSASTSATGMWQPVPRICPDAVEEYSIGVGDLDSTVIGVLFGISYTGVETMYLILDYVKRN